MDKERLYPEQIDRLLNWPLGTAARLARRGKLPHYRLPDGSCRFDRAEVEALVVHIDPKEPAELGRAKGESNER